MKHVESEYKGLVEEIKKKRRKVVRISLIAVLIALMVCSPIYITTADKVLVDYKGIPTIATILIILIILFFEVIAYVAVSAPINAAMDVECDPKKSLALNREFNSKSKYFEVACTTAFTFMGDFETALRYSNRLTSNRAPLMRLNGLFCKARCEFFLQDFEALKNTVSEHDGLLATIKAKPAIKAAVEKRGQTLHLLLALAEKDKDKIAAACHIEGWVNSKAIQGYVDYIKGIAAYTLGEKEEAIYRLMAVKENCGKTIFAQLAKDYLANLNNENAENGSAVPSLEEGNN